MASANFSINLLECPVCYKIPTKETLIFCENGHMVCETCKNKMENCPSCRGKFVNRRNILIEQILDSVTVCCKHCAKMVIFLSG